MCQAAPPEHAHAMKIRLTTGRASSEGDWSPGDVLTVGKELDENEAFRLLESGQAEPVAEKRSQQRETRSAAVSVDG